MNQWEKFSHENRYFQNSLKKELVVTLYGAYYPKTEKKFLEHLRDFMKKNGYVKTKLVSDYQNIFKHMKNVSDLSHQCIRMSDVNFFIVRKNGKNQGVVRELSFLADDPTLIEKQNFSTIFTQKNSYPLLTKLILDDISELDISVKTYTTQTKLKKELLHTSSFFVRKLRSRLQLRTN